MYTIFGFYKFKQLKKISKLKDKLQNFIDDYKIKGTIIISPEGINGSISFLKKNTKQIKDGKTNRENLFYNLKEKIDAKYMFLITTKDIKAGEELTANYNLYTYPKTGVGLQMI